MRQTNQMIIMGKVTRRPLEVIVSFTDMNEKTKNNRIHTIGNLKLDHFQIGSRVSLILSDSIWIDVILKSKRIGYEAESNLLFVHYLCEKVKRLKECN